MKIIHVFRAPVGGLFRHVRDLARAQAQLGHDVAIICDATTGGPAAASALEQLKKHCKLGVHRVAMSRMPGVGDAISARRISILSKPLNADIIHGHGAKGGAYARMIARKLDAKSFYTPHGGVLHYDWASPQGAVFLALERYLLQRTDGLCFVCRYEHDVFARKIGLAGISHAIIHNGLMAEDIKPVKLARKASDFLFIGELRALKGIDILIEAIHRLNDHKKATLTIVGAGAARTELENQVAGLGLESHITFAGAMPAEKALKLGNTVVMPSRAESFPYVMLEAAAAGRTVIASDVGGIGEFIDADCLVPSQDPARLAKRLASVLDHADTYAQAANARLIRLKRDFSVETMARQICAHYQSANAAQEAKSLAGGLK